MAVPAMVRGYRAWPRAGRPCYVHLRHADNGVFRRLLADPLNPEVPSMLYLEPAEEVAVPQGALVEEIPV
jgi:hypothetical protein